MSVNRVNLSAMSVIYIERVKLSPLPVIYRVKLCAVRSCSGRVNFLKTGKRESLHGVSRLSGVEPIYPTSL